jgi:hypothetical protein
MKRTLVGAHSALMDSGDGDLRAPDVKVQPMFVLMAEVTEALLCSRRGSGRLCVLKTQVWEFLCIKLAFVGLAI